jgi:hypothetical protein
LNSLDELDSLFDKDFLQSLTKYELSLAHRYCIPLALQGRDVMCVTSSNDIVYLLPLIKHVME